MQSLSEARLHVGMRRCDTPQEGSPSQGRLIDGELCTTRQATFELDVGGGVGELVHLLFTKHRFLIEVIDVAARAHSTHARCLAGIWWCTLLKLLLLIHIFSPRHETPGGFVGQHDAAALAFGVGEHLEGFSAFVGIALVASQSDFRRLSKQLLLLVLLLCHVVGEQQLQHQHRLCHIVVLLVVHRRRRRRRVAAGVEAAAALEEFVE